MSTYADRQHAYRQRCRSGRVVYRLEADAVELEALLQIAGLLERALIEVYRTVVLKSGSRSKCCDIAVFPSSRLVSVSES